MKKTYILFDHDGVLVDTEILYYRATRNCIKDFGIELSQPDYLALQARGKSAWHMARAKGFSDVAVNAKKVERNRLYQEYISQNPVDIPGVAETLRILSESYKMAIVTTSKSEDFNLIHQNDRITGYMDFCLKLGDYERTKPYPDPYLKALEKFAASPEETIVVEDSQRGLEAAYSAGIDCIIIQNDFTKEQDFSRAALILDKFTDLPAALATYF